MEVRYHLSSFLGDLLRAATVVKKEAGWAFCRPLTSDQSIEMVKNSKNTSERVMIRSSEELLAFKDRLPKEGQIRMDSPAANLTVQPRNLRKRKLEGETQKRKTPR